MKTLLAPLGELNAYKGAVECIGRNKLPVHISGCIDTQKCHFIYGLSQNIPWKVIITQNEIRAREIAEDYRMFDRNVLYYPSKDVIFYSADIHGSAISVERLKVVKAIIKEDSGTIVTTMDAGMELVASLDTFTKAVRVVKEQDIIDIDELTAHLVSIGYERQYQVQSAGGFSIRGGIIDIFPVTEECPFRIELWDNEADTIRSFDVESQRSIERTGVVEIFPASEIMLSDKELETGLENIEKDYIDTLGRLRDANNHTAINRLKDRIAEIRETLEMYHGRIGMESFIRYFGIQAESFFDYFDKEKTVFFIDEPARCIEKMETVETEFRDSMESRLEKGDILPRQIDILYPATSARAILAGKRCVYITTLDILPKGTDVKEQFNVMVQATSSYNKHFELLIDDIKKWCKEGYRVLVLSGSRIRAERLSKDINEYGIPSFYRENPDIALEPCQVMVSYGQLHRGFAYTQQKFVVVTEGDIFGARQKKRKKHKNYDGKSIQSFNELNIGDYVVHENHGLGIYRGIEKLRVDNITKDFIKIEYGDGGNLYVPVSGLDVLQKYAGQDAVKTPKLNKLNSTDWKKTKSKVKGAVKDIAKELVLLYAERQQKQGFQFSPDTVWQKEFEDLFPFEETQDQLDAIAATKKDMESSKVMDRLICGDVGYGKTEIAIRAAFKAVNDGKQVAFLVPTTILAQQHYNTLKERLGDFPVNVEMLSRFRTPAQQKMAIASLKKGQTDIVVGTHRLLSKDVAFKNLGLLVIDEEQRFGVTHKEKIKKMKGDVDVLTLSATPIPRTLHMSLVGIRDMSVLEEPPVDRLPIQTFVMEHNSEIIREAINRELSRGGQVFYVYNRVQHIDEVASEVTKLVPDASVAFAHGQMSERQLENIMLSFINGEIDVLVSTTIIETGLDISNVNTIIIDNADQMGLSQLYQLRGRVGRSNRIAYAFLMYKRDKMLKEIAEKRLAAIKEFTDLGSGIKVAMRDLEIRGAGNLLGSAQSGHMEAVGYDLYCKMLNDAVRMLKGEKKEDEEFETSIDLAVNAFISSTYIKSEFQKLDMYKRIACIETAEEYSDMQDELIDRFGNIPDATENLLKIAVLKAAAHKAYISQIVQKPDGIRFYPHTKAAWNTGRIMAMLEEYQGKLKYVQTDEPYFNYIVCKEDERKPVTRHYASAAKGGLKKKKLLTADDIFHIVEGVIKSIGGLI
ncbi:MAG TPA: transcription-repair coupling factor [Lachnospiraceae bacterium]|nr:transcription-repair coupling factor [Lachnospiraceae bacterium]